MVSASRRGDDDRGAATVSNIYEARASLSKRYALERATGMKFPRMRAAVETHVLFRDLDGKVEDARWYANPFMKWLTTSDLHRVRLELCTGQHVNGPAVPGARGRGDTRPRGTSFFTAVGQARTLQDAAAMALVMMDQALEEGWYCVRLKPTPEEVVWSDDNYLRNRLRESLGQPFHGTTGALEHAVGMTLAEHGVEMVNFRVEYLSAERTTILVEYRGGRLADFDEDVERAIYENTPAGCAPNVHWREHQPAQTVGFGHRFEP